MKKVCILVQLVLGCLANGMGSDSQSGAVLPGAHDAFLQDESVVLAVGSEKPETNITALAARSDGALFAVTENALWRLADNNWSTFAPPPPFSAYKIAVDKNALWISNNNKIACRLDEKWTVFHLPEGIEVTALCPINGSCLMGSFSGLWKTQGQQVVRVSAADIQVLSLAMFENKIIIGSEQGLYSATFSQSSAVQIVPLYPADDRYSWWPQHVSTLVANGKTLWMGCRGGAARLQDGKWTLFTGKEGLPYDHFTCAAIAADSAVWFGTEQGACRYDGRRWAYRASKRWLANDHINAMAAADNGVWIATPAGLTRFRCKTTTLAEKADVFERIIDERHTRMGYVVRCALKKEGDLSSAWINHTDNDGLYTAMYGAAEAFRYGATGHPQAKEKAMRTFRALKLLTDVTGIPGFPARSIIPVDWTPNPNKAMTPHVNKQLKTGDPLWKEIYPRWPTSQDGRYLWKCDTSSDEICGHYFFYGVYYDLVALTEEERQPVRDLVRAITDHIVDHGYKLVDWDGLPTRWANWSPEYVNGPDGWADRGLQSMEILSFLNVACHITGDEKYQKAAQYLRDRHSYHINAISSRSVFPPNLVVPWDNNLAFLSYYGLLKYEKDPERLKLWQASIERTWLFASKQNDPFFTFVYQVFKPEQPSPILEATLPDMNLAMAKAVQTLCGTPQLLIGWKIRNSHRLDVVLDQTPGQRPNYGWSVFGDALPIEERCHLRINSDHFDLDHEQGGGFSEYEGNFFLLPYYLALYHHLLPD